MTNWPPDFPENCPPSSTNPALGDIFRFINRSTPKEKDFMSYYDLKPHEKWGENECQARGLSVYVTERDAMDVAKRVPSLRKSI
ncbi:hypothetical protein [Thioflexithrix psekupsensis]|uniref:Uncharacterized protein n=1 Tax=Thioflexithrix psekupsensis TaxID=1570016 RepID=A0A251X6Z0_9GAMM|nr:hypothetical protein [Thioflexithrix psekupsensis]OUD13100.1 hypothetical protein TPSD3_10650 [Thioflexithrix psekupsensis]